MRKKEIVRRRARNFWTMLVVFTVAARLHAASIDVGDVAGLPSATVRVRLSFSASDTVAGINTRVTYDDTIL